MLPVSFNRLRTFLTLASLSAPLLPAETVSGNTRAVTPHQATGACSEYVWGITVPSSVSPLSTSVQLSSAVVITAASSSIEIHCDNKPFLVVAGVPSTRSADGARNAIDTLLPRFAPPVTAEEVTITLTTADGKKWHARWEEEPASRKQ